MIYALVFSMILEKSDLRSKLQNWKSPSRCDTCHWELTNKLLSSNAPMASANNTFENMRSYWSSTADNPMSLPNSTESELSAATKSPKMTCRMKRFVRIDSLEGIDWCLLSVEILANLRRPPTLKISWPLSLLSNFNPIASCRLEVARSKRSKRI